MNNEVEVISNSFLDVILPLALPKPYTYKIKTAHLKNLGPGYRVAVPFGKRKIYTALVIKVHNVAPQTYEAKPIVTILDKAVYIFLFPKGTATRYPGPKFLN